MRTLLITLASLALAGCASGETGTPHPGDPPIGAQCRLQFNRSDLGAAASLPIPPTTGSINGAEVSVSGKILSIDEDWVVLDDGHSKLWVPRRNVLLLMFP